MDFYRGPALVEPSSLRSKTFSPEPAKLRRKLQKTGPKQPNKRLSSSSSSSSPSSSPRESRNFNPDSKCDSGVRGLQHARPNLAVPPDLSDAKWLEYVRQSGFGFMSPTPMSSAPPSKYMMPSSPRPAIAFQETRNTSINDHVVPEFAHLTVNETSLATSTAGTQSLGAPRRSLSIRRHAKTPVHSIGQLERAAQRKSSAAAVEAPPNAELVADQYRALIDPRHSILTDACSEPAPLREFHHQAQGGVRHRYSEEIHLDSLHFSPAASTVPSPAASDGTLVAFDEDKIYFKPLSLSPRPQSPAEDYWTPSPPRLSFPSSSLSAAEATPPPPLPPPTNVNNISLQICLDLLTKELSSAAAGRAGRMAPELAALQIYVMIEAYERLRDHLGLANLRPEEAGAMEMMLDMWLRALYAIHDSFNDEARSEDSGYEGLLPEELD